MTRRFPPAKWVLPDVVDPPRRRCFVIEVPDNLYHIMAFRGALLDLASGYQWADDPAHTAKDVALVWRDVIAKMHECIPSPATPGVGVETGVDFMIRQNPTNPCILESSLDGITWCQWADLSLCVGNAPQPGAGAEQPRPGGGQACYDGTLNASGQWMLPTVVNAGDILTLDNLTGAGTPGGVNTWYCGNGNTFFAGQCIPLTGGLHSGDPAAAVNHMRLIWFIDGVYYDAIAPLTIPGGVVNAQAVLQVNDDPISDNSGTYQFRVCAQNNQAAIWTHTFDFLLSTGGFSSPAAPGGNPFSLWFPSVGWETLEFAGPSGWYQTILIQIAMPAGGTLLGASGTWNDNYTDTSTDGSHLALNGTNLVTGSTTAPKGNGLHLDWSGSMAYSAGHIFEMLISCSVQGSHDTGSAEAVQVVLSGTGTDPF